MTQTLTAAVLRIQMNVPRAISVRQIVKQEIEGIVLLSHVQIMWVGV